MALGGNLGVGVAVSATGTGVCGVALGGTGGGGDHSVIAMTQLVLYDHTTNRTGLVRGTGSGGTGGVDMRICICGNSIPINGAIID